ncbi:MAG: NUDIX domain-containing protein, partial [Oscillospiraceae bacterium]
GDFNQALMELGAVLCLPNGAPLCERCPVCALCEGFRLGCASALPKKSEKKPRTVQQMTVLCLTDETSIVLRRRPDAGLLAGMWELPWAEAWLDEASVAALVRSWGLTVCAIEPLEAAKHIFTHIEWRMRGWRIYCENGAALPPGWLWADAASLAQQVALPSAFAPLLRQIPL